MRASSFLFRARHTTRCATAFHRERAREPSAKSHVLSITSTRNTSRCVPTSCRLDVLSPRSSSESYLRVSLSPSFSLGDGVTRRFRDRRTWNLPRFWFNRSRKVHPSFPKCKVAVAQHLHAHRMLRDSLHRVSITLAFYHLGRTLSNMNIKDTAKSNPPYQNFLLSLKRRRKENTQILYVFQSARYNMSSSIA